MYTIKTLPTPSARVGWAKVNKNLFDVVIRSCPAMAGCAVPHLLNTTFNDNLLAIACARANNIPLDRCSEQGIVVFNTPGANANAVAELVIGMCIAATWLLCLVVPRPCRQTRPWPRPWKRA